MSTPQINRRHLVALAAALAVATPGLALAQAKPKVAGIYTVPFEQQWAGRLHTALKAAEARGEIEYKASENVSNADYERVMREYATGGNTLIVGEGPHHTTVNAIEHDLCVVYAGHYATETLGVQALGAFLETRFGLPWTFLHLPTGS